jgi:hypothetical protein
MWKFINQDAPGVSATGPAVPAQALALELPTFGVAEPMSTAATLLNSTFTAIMLASRVFQEFMIVFARVLRSVLAQGPVDVPNRQ